MIHPQTHPLHERLTEELARPAWGLPRPSEQLDFVAWLNGLPAVTSLHLLSDGECGATLGRLANARCPETLLGQWRTARAGQASETGWTPEQVKAAGEAWLL